VAGRWLRTYRYARRLIIEAGRQTMPPRLFLLAGSALVRYQLTAAVGYQLADIVGYLLADAVGNQLADIVGYLLADAVGFGLWILWPGTPASPARRLAGPGHGARRHRHRGGERHRQGDEHRQNQDYFMEELRVDHLSPRSDLFTPFTETIISCLS
jgi:hypothetical protein